MTSATDGQSERGSWLDLATRLLEHSRVIVIAALAGGALVVAVTLALPKKYTTTLSFTPVAAPGLQVGAGALAGLAGQFGVQLGAGDPSGSPDFYASLLRSRTILLPLVQHEFSSTEGANGASGSFISLYEISGADSGRTFDEAIRRLRTKHLTVSYDRQTSIVSVSVRTRWRDLSQLMGHQILALIDSFNVGSRRAKAAAEEEFLRGRLDTVKLELRAAEDRLESFLVRNRTYSSDPVLAFEHSRLERLVSLHQGVFSSLADATEQARLAAVRNTPSIAVVDAPTAALRFDRRHTLPKALGGMLAGGTIAFLVLLAGIAMGETRRQSPERMERFARAMRTALAGFGLTRSARPEEPRNDR